MQALPRLGRCPVLEEEGMLRLVSLVGTGIVQHSTTIYRYIQPYRIVVLCGAVSCGVFAVAAAGVGGTGWYL